MFGPPQCLTTASACSWLGQSVSGLRHATSALFKLAFAAAPVLNTLTSLHIVTRRPVLQKVRHHPQRAVSACKHRVSGSLSLPSRGSFHLSLTVLYSIGHQVVFSLRRWSSLFPTGFLVSCGTPDPPDPLQLRIRGCYSLRLGFPSVFRSPLRYPLGVLTPFNITIKRFGLFPFRSPLLRESFVYFLFLRVLRCFSSPGSLPLPYIFR